MKVYVPQSIPNDYKYITNITSNYFDLYNTNNTAGKTLTFYRIYYSFNDDMYFTYSQNYGQYNSLNLQEIERSTSIFSRHDNLQLFTISFVVLFFIIFIINIMTSIVKKGGVLGGLR
jgi:hypothetical protein